MIIDDKSYVVQIKDQKNPPSEDGAFLDETDDLILEEDKTIKKSTVDLAQAEADRILEEADGDAAEILKNAQESAEKIILDAYEKAEEIKQNALEEGKAQGLADGRQQLEAEYKALVDEALAIREEFNEEKKTLIEQSEQEMVALVLGVVDKVFAGRREGDDYLIESLIKTAIDKLGDVSSVVVRVSELDYPIAIACRSRLLMGKERVEKVEFKSDNSLEPGSCVIESATGIVDASLDVQFKSIKDTFNYLLNSSQEDF